MGFVLESELIVLESNLLLCKSLTISQKWDKKLEYNVAKMSY